MRSSEYSAKWICVVVDRNRRREWRTNFAMARKRKRNFRCVLDSVVWDWMCELWNSDHFWNQMFNFRCHCVYLMQRSLGENGNTSRLSVSVYVWQIVWETKELNWANNEQCLETCLNYWLHDIDVIACPSKCTRHVASTETSALYHEFSFFLFRTPITFIVSQLNYSNFISIFSTFSSLLMEFLKKSNENVVDFCLDLNS